MSQSTVAIHTSNRDVLTVNIELCKWFGVVFMLWDHLSYYAGIGNAAIAQSVGSLAFPLFAVALAAACYDMDAAKRSDVLTRMLGWAFVAQLCSALVRDGIMLNVIFTLAVGLWIFHELVEDGEKRWRLIALLGVLSVFTEFAIVGPALVVFLCFALRAGSEGKLRRDLLAGCVALLASLYVFNGGSFVALLTPLVVYSIGLLGEVPRTPRIFYWIYSGQFVIFFLMEISK